MKNKKIIVGAIILLLVFCVSIFLFIKLNKKVEKTIVNTEVLKLEKIDNAECYQGTLISRQSVFIQPQVSGQIASINVKAGDRVQKGQTLILIDSRKQQASLNSYKVKQESLSRNYEIAKIQYKRYLDLYSRKTVSKQELENYENEYKKAKSALDENASQIREQTVQLGYHRITAPFSGIIGDIPVKLGEYVSPETKLLSVTQNEILELNVGIPANKIFEIKQGLPVQVLDFENNVIAESKIRFVSPRVDTNTQTILIKANFENKDGVLKADQSVKVRVVYNEYDGILAPVTSTTFIAGQDFAYVVKDSKGQKVISQVPITLGELYNGKHIVKKGLNAGDCIVIKGIQKIYDGAIVEIGEDE